MFGERPRVTPDEFKYKVRPALSSHGFTDHEIDQVEAAFQAQLQGNPAIPDWKPGVDKEALMQVLSYMRAHPHDTALGPHHWDTVEEVMLRYI